MNLNDIADNLRDKALEGHKKNINEKVILQLQNDAKNFVEVTKTLPIEIYNEEWVEKRKQSLLNSLKIKNNE
jgi:hypothetical protein